MILVHKHPGKLRSRWDGPYVVKRVFENGAIEVDDPRDGRIFKVNGQRLKPALDRFVPEEETISLEDPVYRDEKIFRSLPFTCTIFCFCFCLVELTFCRKYH